MCTTAHGCYTITSLLRPPYGIVNKLTGPVITFARVRYTTHVLVVCVWGICYLHGACTSHGRPRGCGQIGEEFNWWNKRRRTGEFNLKILEWRGKTKTVNKTQRKRVSKKKCKLLLSRVTVHFRSIVSPLRHRDCFFVNGVRFLGTFCIIYLPIKKHIWYRMNNCYRDRILSWDGATWIRQVKRQLLPPSTLDCVDFFARYRNVYFYCFSVQHGYITYAITKLTVKNRLWFSVENLS